ncbi:hypothetical protein H3H37_00295 [Duganella sp. LX20W]|uniref:Uncharacterized protein n=1 Tax=Rugamonas brunnea TaxID=2758569 RepID=A0A7W2EN48_9BURK|nr:hypothetical protein [Rugamonas brunnea]MBA5635508.1 hypothetical protein [Rugamonas brunnea]
MILVASVAVLALPVYFLVGLITIPIGVGLLMLTSSSPWILNLYPFLYAGSGNWNAPVFYLDNAVSIPLTIAQWGIFAFVASIFLREFSRSKMFSAVLILFLIDGIATSAILSLVDIKLMWVAGHT